MAPLEREDDGDRADTAWDKRERSESPEQRADRNLLEILQEIRVLSIGVQVLFGFLLSFPLSSRFATLDSGQKALYTVSLGSAALATALLVGPVAYHRVIFQQHEKGRLVKVANRLILAGLAAVGTAITVALWLMLGIVYPDVPAAVFAVPTALVFISLWLILPITGRRRDRV